MPRLSLTIVVATTTLLVPMFAMAGNQETADQIAQQLRNSGKMSDYHIAVKCKDGTVWLKGRVASDVQMNTAMKLVYNTPGVSRVVNGLVVAQPESEPVEARKQPSSLAQQIPTERQKPSYSSKPQIQQPIQQISAIEPSDIPQQQMAYQPVRPMKQQAPMPMGVVQTAATQTSGMGVNAGPRPMYAAAQGGVSPARYDQPCMPNYAWPSYAAYPNYAGVSYPRQYSATAWPYIGPFYPYPQVPLGWRKVTLQWKDGWWFLDFKDSPANCFR